MTHFAQWDPTGECLFSASYRRKRIPTANACDLINAD
jgi:hypothetical protein